MATGLAGSDGIWAGVVSFGDLGGRRLEPEAQATPIRRVTPQGVNLVTDVLDIENLGDQIAVRDAE